MSCTHVIIAIRQLAGKSLALEEQRAKLRAEDQERLRKHTQDLNNNREARLVIQRVIDEREAAKRAEKERIEAEKERIRIQKQKEQEHNELAIAMADNMIDFEED